MDLNKREELLRAFRELDREKGKAIGVTPGGFQPTMPDGCPPDTVMVGVLLTTTWLGEEYVELGLEHRVPLKDRSNEELMEQIRKTVLNTATLLLRETIVELGERFEHGGEIEDDEEGNDEGFV